MPDATSLVIREKGSTDVSLVNPDTGEVVPLADAPMPLIAAVMGDIQVRIDELQELKRGLGRVMVERMDKNASWTARARGVKVTAPSPVAGAVTWDAELLYEILDALVAEDVITREAALKACQQRVEHVALAPGIKALCKNPVVKTRLQPALREAPAKPRNARVEVVPGER